MTKSRKVFIYGSLVLSVLFWAVLSDAWGYSKHFLTGLPNDWNRYVYGYISRLIWVMPFLFLVVKEKQEEAVPPKDVFAFHFHWKSLSLTFGIITICVLCEMFFVHGGWWVNPGVIFPQELCKYLLVGFVEELVYRGFGLNVLWGCMNGRKANLIASAFFAALHLPAYFIHWYCDGTFLVTAMLAQAMCAFLLGLLFGIVFRKSKSVWASAIVHFWYDFAIVMLVG